MSEEEEILKQTVIAEEKPKSDFSKKLKEQKKAKRKKTTKKIIILVVLALFSYAIMWALKPFKASEEYGICRSLLELFVPYPYSIYVSEIKQLRDGSLKLWYTHTDAFGEYRMEEFQCKLIRNSKTGVMELLEIKMHKVYLEADKVKHLNNSLVYFREHPLILNWPAALPDSIAALHLDFDSARRIILNITK